MLIWVCALACEAKPVIDFYRLKKVRGDEAFDLYRNDDMACVISGTGKLASAAATAWVAARESTHVSPRWINLGIAGAAEHEPGSLFRLHQIIDAESGKRYYPIIPEKWSITGHVGLCLNQPSTDYNTEYLFDMESSGFFPTASRFSSAELIRSLKIVSDNQQVQIGRDRQRVSDLIAQNMKHISAQAQALLDLSDPFLSLDITPEAWEAINTLAHFSTTERALLRGLLRYLLNRQYHISNLTRSLSQFDSAKTILCALQQMCRKDSQQLT